MLSLSHAGGVPQCGQPISPFGQRVSMTHFSAASSVGNMSMMAISEMPLRDTSPAAAGARRGQPCRRHSLLDLRVRVACRQRVDPGQAEVAGAVPAICFRFLAFDNGKG